jgi:hypothetical protein
VSAGIEESELEGSLEDFNEPFSLNSSLGFIEAPVTFLEDEDEIAHDYYAALSQQPSMNIEETLFDNTGDFSDVGGAGIRYEPPSKTSIRFADDVVFSTSDFGLTSTHTPESTSISENSLDLFESDSSSPDSMSNLSAPESVLGGSETDEDEKSEEEEDKEKKIIRSMMFAGFGMGLISLLGFGMQKIWSRFSKNNDLEGGADPTQVADKATNGATGASEGGVHGLDAGMQVTDVATQSGSDACNASMNASQANMSSFVGAPITPNPGMTGPQ